MTFATGHYIVMLLWPSSSSPMLMLSNDLEHVFGLPELSQAQLLAPILGIGLPANSSTSIPRSLCFGISLFPLLPIEQSPWPWSCPLSPWVSLWVSPLPWSLCWADVALGIALALALALALAFVFAQHRVGFRLLGRGM